MSTTTCPDCGGPKRRKSKRCRSCAMWGNQYASVRWTADRIDELRDRLLVYGETARQAALAMGTTRNAVLGAMYRLRHPNAARNYVPRHVAPHPFQLLDHTQCVYPIGHPKDPDFSFCAAPRAEGSSYCATHHELCHVAEHKGDLERLARVV